MERRSLRKKIERLKKLGRRSRGIRKEDNKEEKFEEGKRSLENQEGMGRWMKGLAEGIGKNEEKS